MVLFLTAFYGSPIQMKYRWSVALRTTHSLSSVVRGRAQEASGLNSDMEPMLSGRDSATRTLQPVSPRAPCHAPPMPVIGLDNQAHVTVRHVFPCWCENDTRNIWTAFSIRFSPHQTLAGSASPKLFITVYKSVDNKHGRPSLTSPGLETILSQHG